MGVAAANVRFRHICGSLLQQIDAVGDSLEQLAMILSGIRIAKQEPRESIRYL